MAKKKQKNTAFLSLLKKGISFLWGPGRTAALAVVLIAGFVGAAMYGWSQVRGRVLSSSEYQVTVENLHITPPPKWIHSDIRATAFRDLNLDGPLSVMAPDATKRVADAFSVHPWVARIKKVSKHYPAAFQIDLEYRRPVCMVESSGGRGLRPVDVEGVTLPHADFSVREALRYPRLVGIDTVPIGPVGTSWRDDRVLGAARIATAFGDDWQRLKLERIEVGEMIRNGFNAEPTYLIYTKGETKIVWGCAPGSKAQDETPAGDKIKQLKKFVAKHGSLEKVPALDVRHPGAVEIVDRTAAKVDEKQLQ